MPKKNMTLEERQAWGQKMKDARKKKAAEAGAPVAQLPPIEEVTSKDTVTLTTEQFQDMMDRLSNLEQQKPESPQPQSAIPRIDQATGQAIGVTEKHSINPNDYKDPTEALYNLPELRRFAFRENYVLRWTVTPTRYQTAFGTWFVEPRFELTLLRRRFDEEGVERPDKIIVGRASFFEDLPANLMEADLAGLSVDDVGTPDFSEKMKMYRYKLWLVENLTPKRPSSTKKKVKLEVIGGTAYEVEEGSEVVV
jgi:hypothetical protein